MPTYKPGERIIHQKFIVEKLLGTGAFGEVYLCKHIDLQVWRAIKLVHRGLPGVGSTVYDDLFQRFQQEARIGASIKHDHIIQVYDFEQMDDYLFLVLEYAAGGSLLERIEAMREHGRWMDEEKVVKIAKAAACGLSELHERQVIHRDLKPSNLLLTKEGTLKIADLGLAQVPGGMSQRSQMGSMVNRQPHPGTPDYMSPEQREKFGALQPPADIYALGVVLFELLTGKNPFYEEPGTRVSDLRPGISPALGDLISRMLDENPRQRPWNGKRLLETLEGLENSRETVEEKETQPVVKTVKTKAPQPVIKIVEITPQPEKKPDVKKTEQPKPEPQLGIGSEKVIDLGDGVTMEFVYVPAGEFWMGADEDDKHALNHEKPKHKVSLDAYWMGKYPVTNEQYACFVNKNGHKIPSNWKGKQIPPGKENHSVVYINWHDAQKFTVWLSKQTGLKIHLPTEAQWEKAARGVDGRIYPWGNEKPQKTLANYSSQDTIPVGKYEAGKSPYGCYDMAGNVWEWVKDWYDKDYYQNSPQSNPQGPNNGLGRVQRGGSWYFIMWSVRASFRGWFNPESAYGNSGFRCAMSEASL